MQGRLLTPADLDNIREMRREHPQWSRRQLSEHLASHLLALSVRRLSRDWQARYGHPVWLAETFVQEDRFKGTAYKAAGWIRVGQTTGRTRQDRHHCVQTPIKSVWVKPLHPRFAQSLTTL